MLNININGGGISINDTTGGNNLIEISGGGITVDPSGEISLGDITIDKDGLTLENLASINIDANGSIEIGGGSTGGGITIDGGGIDLGDGLDINLEGGGINLLPGGGGTGGTISIEGGTGKPDVIIGGGDINLEGGGGSINIEGGGGLPDINLGGAGGINVYPDGKPGEGVIINGGGIEIVPDGGSTGDGSTIIIEGGGIQLPEGGNITIPGAGGDGGSIIGGDGITIDGGTAGGDVIIEGGGITIKPDATMPGGGSGEGITIDGGGISLDGDIIIDPIIGLNTTLGELTDVVLDGSGGAPALVDGNVIKWNDSESRWEPGEAGAGGSIGEPIRFVGEADFTQDLASQLISPTQGDLFKNTATSGTANADWADITGVMSGGELAAYDGTKFVPMGTIDPGSDIHVLKTGDTMSGALTIQVPGGCNETGLTVANDAEFTCDIEVGGKLDVTGDISTDSNIDVGGKLDVAGSITGGAGLDITGDVGFDGKLDVTGDITTDTNIEVGGKLDVVGDITTNNDVHIKGELQTDVIVSEGGGDISIEAPISIKPDGATPIVEIDGGGLHVDNIHEITSGGGININNEINLGNDLDINLSGDGSISIDGGGIDIGGGASGGGISIDGSNGISLGDGLDINIDANGSINIDPDGSIDIGGGAGGGGITIDGDGINLGDLPIIIGDGGIQPPGGPGGGNSLEIVLDGITIGPDDGSGIIIDPSVGIDLGANGNISLDGNINAGGDITVGGDIDLTGDLGVTGNVNFKGDVIIGDAGNSCNDSLTINSAVDANCRITYASSINHSTLPFAAQEIVPKAEVDRLIKVTDDKLANYFLSDGGTITNNGSITLTSTGEFITASTGGIDLNGGYIVNLKTPGADTDAATKKYVDDAVDPTKPGSIVKDGKLTLAGANGAKLATGSASEFTANQGSDVTVTFEVDRTEIETIIGETVGSGVLVYMGTANFQIPPPTNDTGHVYAADADVAPADVDSGWTTPTGPDGVIAGELVGKGPNAWGSFGITGITGAADLTVGYTTTGVLIVNTGGSDASLNQAVASSDASGSDGTAGVLTSGDKFKIDAVPDPTTILTEGDVNLTWSANDSKISISGGGTDATLTLADGSNAGLMSSDHYKELENVSSTYVPLAGGTMEDSANLTFAANGEVLGLPDTPSGDNAASSKKYVDTQITGLSSTYVTRVNGVVDSGGLTVTAGGLTVTAGGLTVTADGASIGGDTAVTGKITSSDDITATGSKGYCRSRSTSYYRWTNSNRWWCNYHWSHSCHRCYYINHKYYWYW